MKFSDYHVGDRVRVNENFTSGYPEYNCFIVPESIGTVVNISTVTHYVRVIYVEFEYDFPGAHNCGRFAKSGHGWGFTSLSLLECDEYPLDIIDTHAVSAATEEFVELFY